MDITTEEENSEEELRVGDGVADSCLRDVRVPGLVWSRSSSFCPSDVNNSEK